MAKHSTAFEADAGSLVLASAIMLYRASGASPIDTPCAAPAFASLHAIEQQDGRPVIGAGRPLSRAQLRKWTEALGTIAAAPEILADNVLVHHHDLIAWWIPARVRAAHFAIADPAKGLRVLGQRITVPVPYPAHVLVATRMGLRVCALADSRRPTQDTQLLHSPVLNVYSNGSLCWGNIPQPKALALSSMAQYEAAVFDSWSTHPNIGQDQTITGRGGLVRLWDGLAARGARHFPTGRLKPFTLDRHLRANGAPVTLGQLVARSIRP